MAQPRIPVRGMLGIIVAILVLVSTSCGAQAIKPSPTPTPEASSPKATVPTPATFPDAANTGVPPGTHLTPYTESCAFQQAGTVIKDKIISCDHIEILAPNITISSSELHGWIDVGPATAHLTLEDSELDAGKSQTPAIGFQNVTVQRTEIRGGQTSVQCASNCLIEDSLLHDQMSPVGAQHLGGYLSNGGSNVVLRHNTIACTPHDNSAGGGCTGSIQIFGDFAPLRNFRFEDNLVEATPGGYCASFGQNPGKKFGSDPSHIVVLNNVFQRGHSGKCGVYGATTSFFGEGKGNVFKGNTWDNGSPLRPNA